jgi:glycosyltransferase involved in cell wall biosynthesis
MKISGFTITKNAVKYNYPLKESILSILPICDEFIINLGESEDGTLELIKSIQSSKIKVFQTKWDFSKGSEELANQTNFALSKCSGDWAFYLQNDEVVHEKDLEVLAKIMQNKLKDDNIDVIRFRYFHFYSSFYRYRIDAGWYQKENRIIRNNNTIKSTGDAKGFKRLDEKDLKRFFSPCYIYHYGWIQNENKMKERQSNVIFPRKSGHNEERMIG